IGATRISIPPTLLVTAIGQLEDSGRAVTMDVKKPEDQVYIVGATHNDLGATHYFAQMKYKGGSSPRLRDPKTTIEIYRWLHRAMRNSLVASCHDVSDGGLGVTLAETSFAGGLGLIVDLREIPGENADQDDTLLFSETPGRFIVTVAQEAAQSFEILMGGAVKRIGNVTADQRLVITGLGGKTIIDEDV
ncbi:MAG: phosphoribosylformylglycinamidine synthase, partial [Deltaproteobacteria bacterium]|nr:phosphoribosylformylglycinamidine synthase [Deltaproteobacteria bacterium]